MATSGMGSHDRDHGLKPNDPMLSEDARQRLFARKEAASRLAQELADSALALTPKLPPDLATLFEAFQHLPAFAKQFELATKVTFYAARGESDAIKSIKSDLIALADRIEAMFRWDGDLPHHAYVLLDPEQIRNFTASLP